MFNRITGVGLSGLLYVFGLAYLAAPIAGWNLTSAALAASFAKWPVVGKVAMKMLLALPFTFHSFNGLRHLAWDMGMNLTNRQVANSGWACIGISVVTAVALAVFV